MKAIKQIVKGFFQASWYPNRRILLESVPDMSCQTYPLFEYMLSQHFNDSYEIVWFVTDKEKFRDVRIKNVRFVNMEPKNAWEKIQNTYLRLTARAMLYSNRYMRKYSDKQILIYLKHGTCIKSRLCHCREDEVNECDACISISSFFTEVDDKELHIPAEKFAITGYPRNDYLLMEPDPWIRAKLNFSEDEKIVLWMPTFRQTAKGDRVDSTFDMPLGIPCLYTKEQCMELNERLREEHITLVLKPHPAQDMSFIKDFGLIHFRILTDREIQDAGIQLYQFIRNTDALITDYSSIYYDYLLLKKPIGITLDDFHVYKKETGFAFDNILEILAGKHMYNAQDIMDFMKEIADGVDPYSKSRAAVCKTVHRHTDNRSSIRVYDLLIGLLEERYPSKHKNK